MATLYREITVDAKPDDAWSAVRDIGAYHQRVFPGVLTATTLEPGVRTVTFADGTVVREPIVSIDDAHRRVAWTVEGGPLAHHNASIQVFAEPDGRSRVVWITDVLPDAAAPMVEKMVDGGAAVIKEALGR
jgi:carbon monoxide dehydrogenase subunit G